MANVAPTITEPTPEGEQVLVPGIAPITPFDRLQFRVAAPIARSFGGRAFEPKKWRPLFLNTLGRNPHATQKPCDIGLFDLDARDQCDLIDFLRTTENSPSNPDQTRKD